MKCYKENYNKYHETLDINCCSEKINFPKTPKKKSCCEGMNLPSYDKQIEQYLKDIKHIINKFIIDYNNKLKCQNKKIDETMIYIKNNLENYIRDLMTSLEENGEIEELILNTIDNILKTDLEELYNENNEKLETKLDNLKGVTYERPLEPNLGMYFFDTTLKIPIWWNGTIWVDANNNEV